MVLGRGGWVRPKTTQTTALFCEQAVLYRKFRKSSGIFASFVGNTTPNSVHNPQSEITIQITHLRNSSTTQANRQQQTMQTLNNNTSTKSIKLTRRFRPKNNLKEGRKYYKKCVKTVTDLAGKGGNGGKCSITDGTIGMYIFACLFWLL
jgi:hypothetical protein